MRFFAYTALSVSAFVASGVQAAHTLTLKNNCGFAVGLKLSNWPGHPAYTGPAIGTISSKGSKTVTVPNGWDGRICDAAGGCGNGDCYGKCSMTEFNMDANGLNYYDISNIQAYTVPQKITSNCDSVTCGSATCPCDQATRQERAQDLTRLTDRSGPVAAPTSRLHTARSRPYNGPLFCPSM
ncbi:pathogenesis-related protein PR5K (thaumatin family) [Ceratobasidium sp. AG-Ba]|nr:pathogenesis-related protein PR5K (thaumatin family) [Ceratobasidium sp. AG-Ba]